MRELKIGSFATKQIEGDSVVGIAAVMGNLDSYDDRLWLGSFTKTLRERAGKIYHLWQHDFGCPPIAVIEELREVPREELPPSVIEAAPEATGGLLVKRRYFDTPRAKEVLANIVAGSPLQMSFAYDAIKYDFEEKPGAKYEWERIRNLREVRLYETSDVLWGANDATVASKGAYPIEVLVKQLIGRELPLDVVIEQIGSRELPLDVLVKNLGGRVLDLSTLASHLHGLAKAGRRNASDDLERINQIGTLAVELGATSVVLAEPEAEPEPTNEDSAKADSSRAGASPLTANAYSYRLKLAERRLVLRQE